MNVIQPTKFDHFDVISKLWLIDEVSYWIYPDIEMVFAKINDQYLSSSSNFSSRLDYWSMK